MLTPVVEDLVGKVSDRAKVIIVVAMCGTFLALIFMIGWFSTHDSGGWATEERTKAIQVCASIEDGRARADCIKAVK